MKTSKYIMVALVGGLTLLSACDSMEDTYKDFLKGGEVVYRTKAKELVAEPGRNRVKLSWQLEYPTHVVKCEIREGNKVLATLPIEYEDIVELEYLLTNLEEKTYTLSVYSFDEVGNNSIKSDVIVEVYGDRYISTLSSERSIESVLREVANPNKVLVTFSTSSSSKLVGTVLHYKSTSGTDQSIKIPTQENSVELTDVAADSYFNVQDLWKPVTTAIDEFASPMREYSSSNLPSGVARLFGIAYKNPDSSLYIELSKANASVTHSVIRYDGKEIEVPSATNSVILTDVPKNAVITMSTTVTTGALGTQYLTPLQSIETFGLLTKLTITRWNAVDKSSDQNDDGNGNGLIENAIDGNLSTYWHTQYSPTTPAYPHYITVDMGESHSVKGIAVARRNGNVNIAAKMKLEVSGDNDTWTLVGEFSPNNSIDGLQLFEFNRPEIGRYFKLTGVTSSTANAFMCISEICLYE